jgi:hypothetical protein
MIDTALEEDLDAAVGEGIEEPMRKCDHGVYIAKGDVIARYCSACYPDGGHLFPADRRAVLDFIQPERILDTADYMSQPLSDRLADAEVLSC